MVEREHVAPQLGLDSYNCPHCGAFAGQKLLRVSEVDDDGAELSGDIAYMTFRRCHSCEELTIWNDSDILIYPITNHSAPLPHPEMPEVVKKDYEEARAVAPLSSRAGGALLRLGLQRLCEEVTGKKGKIDDLIGDLEEKGLSSMIVNAMDIVRVTGNESVHPGTMNIEDDPKLVSSLFSLMNMIVEELIARPKRIQEMFDNLPDGPKRGIEQRSRKRRQKSGRDVAERAGPTEH